MEQQKIERVLLVIFYVGTLAAIFSYFYFGEDRTYFYYCGGTAIVARGIHYTLKFLM